MKAGCSVFPTDGTGGNGRRVEERRGARPKIIRAGKGRFSSIYIPGCRDVMHPQKDPRQALAERGEARRVAAVTRHPSRMGKGRRTAGGGICDLLLSKLQSRHVRRCYSLQRMSRVDGRQQKRFVKGPPSALREGDPDREPKVRFCWDRSSGLAPIGSPEVVILSLLQRTQYTAPGPRERCGWGIWYERVACQRGWVRDQ
ncbi:hypothetical protein B0T25DRAFT_28184 [Lasiosphaeria hispida]|uniref:Uncharacterized protein n=1 Tax=Lasiosphaeria hispida TaxID=260671 RepID=A0AAJ0MJT8_9PEZI|nr:hypothetical protein B0T25DRAFT_28184 [Lasiosphaeria hispida]